MSLLELTIGRIFLLFENITNLLLGQTLFLLKSSFLILILIFCFFLIFVWVGFEIKNRDETSKWQFYFNSLIRYFLGKRPKKKFEEIKNIFYKDKFLALEEIEKFLNFVLETFGYEGNFEEKLDKINEKILPNLKELKKASQIVKLIKEKINRKENLDLKDEEIIIVFHEYEKALYHLNVINKEDFLASNLK